MKITDALIPGNHTKGRSRGVDMLVVHVMEGTMEGTLSWFRNPAAKVSAHYGISRQGEIVRYVRDGDTAWHAGRIDRPTAPLVLARPEVNPNSYSIGIENEGTGNEPPTAAQIQANVWLIRALCERYALPISRWHIVGHREIFAGKACPGMIDVDDLVIRAKLHPGIPEPSGELAVSPPEAPAVDLTRIIIPERVHFEAAAKVRGWNPLAMSADQWLIVTEAVLRVAQLSGRKELKAAADAIARIIKGGT